MRVSPEDRRNLAQLGLTVLVMGLVFGPLSHALVDHAGFQLPDAREWLSHGGGEDHSHPHSHSQGGRSHQHAPDSLQHLTALFAPAGDAAPPVVRVEAVARVEALPPASPPRVAGRVHPSMPQGP